VLLFGAAETKTYVGVITDTMCAADHAHMNAGPDPKCVRDCVKAGYKYALLHEGRHVLKLSDQQTPEQYAGQKVRITGKLYEKTRILAVEKIEPAK
jgi:hypothetical protein